MTLDGSLCLFEEQYNQKYFLNDENSCAFFIMLAGHTREFHFDNLNEKNYFLTHWPL